MSDLRERLRAEASLVDAGSDARQRVQDRIDRRARHRRTSAAALGLVVAFGLVLGLISVRRGIAPDEPIAPSPTEVHTTGLVKSGGTYALRHFHIERATGAAGAERQRVSFLTMWTTATYPGEATCRITLLASDGSRVASQRLSLSTYERRAATSTDVAVTRLASQARGRCGPGMVSDGTSHYVFTDPRLVGDSFVATVSWSGSTPAGDAACAVRVVAPNGRDTITTFTLAVGPGDRLSVHLRSVPPTGSIAQTMCEPYTRPQQLAPRYWTFGAATSAQ